MGLRKTDAESHFQPGADLKTSENCKKKLIAYFLAFDISEDGYNCLKRSENCKKIFKTLQNRC